MIVYGLLLAVVCSGIVYWLRRRIVEKQAESPVKSEKSKKKNCMKLKLNFFCQYHA